MSDFPFPPRVVGNLCSGCCDDCIKKLNNPKAKCCKEGKPPNFNNACFIADCIYCKSLTDGTKKRTNKCTDPDDTYLEKGETSCCYGVCYHPDCYECKSANGQGPATDSDNGVHLKGHPNVVSCCRKGNKATLLYTFHCEKCSPEGDKIVCKDDISKPNCCVGSGECFKGPPCDTCETIAPPPPPNNKTNKVDKKCKDTAEPDCCAGSCWNSAKDKCRECKNVGTTTEMLESVPDCNCCENHTGDKQCCKKDLMCCNMGESKGECYDNKCEVCE